LKLGFNIRKISRTTMDEKNARMIASLPPWTVMLGYFDGWKWLQRGGGLGYL
jgi:hypothetical protein